MLVFYSEAGKIDGKKFWLEYGKKFYETTKSLLKPNDEVKQMATSLTADAKTADEKLQKLYEFCRTKITNTSNDALGLTADDRKKLKDNKSPADTLKRGTGTSADVDLLFAALASGLGFDARIALVPDRGDIFFDEEIQQIPNDYFLQPSNIAVNVESTWKFFNPGYNYIPFGMLRWQEEATQALITDPKQPVWVLTPLADQTKSVIKRRAKLNLSEDGTLEGEVSIEYTGHPAIERKEDIDDESETEREKAVMDELKSKMSAAEISNLKIENVTDHVKPLVYSFNVKFPGYAQRTGKRLFLQPAFFQHGSGPLFASTDRRYPVYFHYPWSEDDEVEINLPAGFALDNAEAPASFGSGKISEYKPRIAVTTDMRSLVYSRSFFFGGGGNILYPVSSYGQLRMYFDEMSKSDNHTIALKQGSSN